MNVEERFWGNNHPLRWWAAWYQGLLPRRKMRRYYHLYSLICGTSPNNSI